MIPLPSLLVLFEKVVAAFAKVDETLNTTILECLLSMFCLSLRHSSKDQRDRFLRAIEQSVSRSIDDTLATANRQASSESNATVVALCTNLRSTLSRASTEKEFHSNIFSKNYK